MKNLFLAFITLAIIGCGTDQGEGNFYNYSIINESGKDITINSYRTIYPIREIPVIIQLANGENLTKTYQDALPPSGYDFGVFFEGDSIIINFNNEKKQVFTFITNNNNRNPFSYAGITETFIFTTQDYENAEDCNGNCD